MTDNNKNLKYVLIAIVCFFLGGLIYSFILFEPIENECTRWGFTEELALKGIFVSDGKLYIGTKGLYEIEEKLIVVNGSACNIVPCTYSNSHCFKCPGKEVWEDAG